MVANREWNGVADIFVKVGIEHKRAVSGMIIMIEDSHLVIRRSSCVPSHGKKLNFCLDYPSLWLKKKKIISKLRSI